MAIKPDKLVRGAPPINSYYLLNMCSREATWQTYLHYHNNYGHKIYQDGDISQGASTLNKVARWGHVKN